MITKQELLDKIEHANSNNEYLRIVRKYLIHGIPYVFKDNLVSGVRHAKKRMNEVIREID